MVNWIALIVGFMSSLFPSRYTFEVRSYSLSLPGCRHICRKTYLQPQCCPGHWGPDCMGKWHITFLGFWHLLLSVPSDRRLRGRRPNKRKTSASFSRKSHFRLYVENLSCPLSFSKEICFPPVRDLSFERTPLRFRKRDNWAEIHFYQKDNWP